MIKVRRANLFTDKVQDFLGGTKPDRGQFREDYYPHVTYEFYDEATDEILGHKTFSIRPESAIQSIDDADKFALMELDEFQADPERFKNLPPLDELQLEQTVESLPPKLQAVLQTKLDDLQHLIGQDVD